jgi:Integrase core domain
MKKPRNHDAGFKARVALEILKGKRMVSELAAEYGVHPTMIPQWIEPLAAIGSSPMARGSATGHRTYPYLLGGLRVDRPNQVWCADITCIPMRRGFLYLLAVMDWFTRKALAWRISNTLEADFCVEALNEAIHRSGPPEIMNTDQDSQFTSFDWTDRLKRVGTRMSMDGKGRCLDNPRAFLRTDGKIDLDMSRLWRSLNHERVYLHAWETSSQAKAGIWRWDHLPQPPTPSHCPWQTTARRGQGQRNRNRSAGAGSCLNQPEICPRIGE